MNFKVTSALLTILAAASALPYDLDWRYGHYWNQHSAGSVASTQATEDWSGCVAINESRKGVDYVVRVCKADKEDTSSVCLGTRVHRCCPTPSSMSMQSTSSLSTSIVKVAGEDITLSYHITEGGGVCYKIDDNHLRAKMCSTLDESCQPQCDRISTACFDNTITGDLSSCTNDQCNCKPKYLPPDCCECDTRRYYKPDCIEFCSENCLGFRPRQVGGCATCREGWVTEPECCLCDQVGNETHAFYRSADGQLCLPFCKQNCAVRGERGCDSCEVGYVSEPECCDCDTIGNETHAFYMTPDGRCLPFCKKNCAVIGERGCDSCEVGYVSVPECCDCDTIGNETHAFYRTTDGRCLPFCKQNCAKIGERGCESCKEGFGSVPNCCHSTRCDKDQDLYFLIDATASNNFFCHLISVVQVLVAAFNPSSTSNSGTKITAWLFGEGDRAGPSPVFDSSMSCNKIVNERLLSLTNEFGKCLDNDRKYTSPVFPSLCGQLTSAVSGLKQIANEVEKKGKSRNRAVVILTDGTIRDDDTERQAVYKRLANTIIIAGGLQDADFNNLNDYTHSKENIKVKETPIELGRAIVDRLQKTKVLCDDHATNITKSLSAAEGNKLNNFCNCHRLSITEKGYCNNQILTYPKCGGDLTIGAAPKESLEEEILAAVESVLENYSG